MSHNEDVYHVTPFSTYIRVFLILVVLTVLTVAVAQVDFGALNTLIAYGIATVKAFLVMAYFMHLKFPASSHASGPAPAPLEKQGCSRWSTRKTEASAHRFVGET